jgi:hypothetical protein
VEEGKEEAQKRKFLDSIKTSNRKEMFNMQRDIRRKSSNAESRRFCHRSRSLNQNFSHCKKYSLNLSTIYYAIHLSILCKH